MGSSSPAVAAALKINLSSVIFSSAARSAKATAAVSGGENLAAYANTYNLRLEGPSITGEIRRNTDYTEITAKDVPTGGTYYLMVQGVSDDGANYAYSKEISSGTSTIKTSDIKAVWVSSFEGAKAWVEKASADSDGQLLYASSLTTIGSSTPLPTIDPTINSTSTSTVYAPNKKLSEVEYPPVTGTAGSWSWDDPNAAVGDVGSHSFNATFTPTDTNTYNTVTKSISVTVTKATLPITESNEENNNNESLDLVATGDNNTTLILTKLATLVMTSGVAVAFLKKKRKK